MILHLRVKEAEATLLSARLSYLPSFSLSPQGTVSSFDGAKATQTYTLPVSASWEIDLFGRITNAKRRAKAVLAQSREYEQAVRTQLVSAAPPHFPDSRFRQYRKNVLTPDMTNGTKDYQGYV